MRKIWHLSTCGTNKKIIHELGGLAGFEFQEIKSSPITPEQLDALKEKTGSYDALFSRQSRKYKELGLKDKNLSETEIRQFILEEYTFLKRPVLLIDGEVFAGNAPKTIQAIKEILAGLK